MGQIAQVVYEYLDAPVSLKEILEDTGTCGEHRPDIFYRQAACDDETKYRYALGPFIKQQERSFKGRLRVEASPIAVRGKLQRIVRIVSYVSYIQRYTVILTIYLSCDAISDPSPKSAGAEAERYNRLLDSAQLDVLLVPAAYNATPDLWEALTGTMDALDAEGRPCKSSMWKSVYPINEPLRGWILGLSRELLLALRPENGRFEPFSGRFRTSGSANAFTSRSSRCPRGSRPAGPQGCSSGAGRWPTRSQGREISGCRDKDDVKHSR